MLTKIIGVIFILGWIWMGYVNLIKHKPEGKEVTISKTEYICALICIIIVGIRSFFF